MPARRSERLYTDDLGRLEVVDPDFHDLPLMRSLDPGFRIRRRVLPNDGAPRFQQARRAGVGVSCKDLARSQESELWAFHRSAMAQLRSGCSAPVRQGEADLLSLKVELAFRLAAPCRLCPRQCGVDRLSDETGLCGLGAEALLAEAFPHIAEEPQINPSFLLSLAGCGLRCQFCQQAGLLYPVKCGSVPLSQVHWGECALRGARTISFAGGNPDESLPGVLSFLARAPESLQLPVVWNSNAYSTPETVALLEGVVDIYLPDFKFGCEDCANSLAGAPDYPELAAQSIVAYQAQGVPVIVRILVLPGHVDCCHTPALKVLSVLANPLLTISIRGQYRPLGGLLNDAGAMSGRASAEEVLHVVQHARGLDLNMTEDLAGAEM